MRLIRTTPVLLACVVMALPGHLPVRAADLSFQRLALAQYDGGPPNPADYEYVPAEAVWVTARVAGFERSVKDRDEGLEEVRISWQLRAEDPSGTLIAPPLRGLIEETIRDREDKDWTPRFQVRLEVPNYAPRGTYKILATIHDEVSKQEAKAEVQFRVRGEEAPPKDAPLGLRDFRFLAREDDRFGMQPAVYRPGAPLFARFEIVGHAMQGNNHFAVEYGLEILSPPNVEGVSKTMFRQESAAAESAESFYAQRWIPAGFGLNLDPDVAAGEYTLVVSVRDKVSNKTTESRQTFSVKP